ncbi:hypothetical protein FQP90_01070 [Paenarthrobacter nitroguajacolicus]|uniref:Uncharacterized protein n=1 Tax=Paenarthrobacter nitroguajacolicus TaxID=211146 RepID=A0A558HCA2_PAENT|nr:DUF6188 family protein [Paenarthrobacter nitroguajacolicus]TVU66765.1 hypothetical protein FQP90_01070 [Paenarthrobacter nitroguajacolicus]
MKPSRMLWTWPTTFGPDEIVRCMVDYAFSIETQGGIVLRVENEFIYETASGLTHRLDPAGVPSLLGPALSIARSSVTAGIADDRGTLHLDFADGSAIAVPADEQYEAWTLNGPDGLLLVSTPGGSLARWGLGTE